jgi:hypothetical protein
MNGTAPPPPPTPQQITDANAAGPASASVDGRSGTAHNIADMIDYEKWRYNIAAAQNSQALGFKVFGTRPTGALGTMIDERVPTVGMGWGWGPYP